MSSNEFHREASDARGSDEPFRTHSECYACPVGSFFSGVHDAQPDAMEHLLSAAHELLDVARSAIDTADAAIERQHAARRGDQREWGDGPDRDAGARRDADATRPTSESRTATAAKLPRRVRRIEIV